MNRPASDIARPWAWIPSLYLVQALPNVVISSATVPMFKRLGFDNAEIALYTGWLYLPWVIKPLWSPLVELLGANRRWVLWMQLIMGAGFACVALSLPGSYALQITIAFLWLIAFSSATHDIAADGLYIEALDSGQQSYFVGVRSTFFRIGMISAQGLLVMFAGRMEKLMPVVQAWQLAMGLVAAILLVLAAYHLWALPRLPEKPRPTESAAKVLSGYWQVLAAFFQKKDILFFIGLILLYRLGEGLLVKMIPAFMLDTRAAGGLGLSTEMQGLLYGTFGVISLMAGGIAGGMLISRYGLKAMRWYMVAAINIPNLLYVYLAYTQPSAAWVTGLCIAAEQLGYGFGFSAFMVYLLYAARGSYQTAHYALCTGFMALGMMLPGMLSGKIQMALGYPLFFIATVIATVPAFVMVGITPLDPNFGKRDTP